MSRNQFNIPAAILKEEIRAIYVGPSDRGLRHDTIYALRLHQSINNRSSDPAVYVEMLIPPFVVYTYETIEKFNLQWRFLSQKVSNPASAIISDAYRTLKNQ